MTRQEKTAWSGDNTGSQGRSDQQAQINRVGKNLSGYASLTRPAANWCLTTLGAIAIWGAGGTPSRSNPNFYTGNVPWFKTGDLGPKIVFESEELITEEAISKSSAKLFPKGSVAIAMYGATIGKTSILGINATTNQACAVGNPINGITTTEFLHYLLRNEKENFVNIGKGGAQPNISQTVIKEYQINLPPLAEQQQIAAKLDELLAQVDSIKTRLDAIPKILKRFRQSILAAAVSGKLTEDWHSEKHCYRSIENDLEIPENWSSVELAELVDYVTSGSRGWADYYSDMGAIFIRSQDINTDELVLQDIAYVDLPSAVEGRRTKVERHDLLVTITGANVTKCARIKVNLDEAYVSQHVALIRLKNIDDAPFLEFALKATNAGRKQLMTFVIWWR
jgi:type I restriction enzyme, S subunit